MSQEDKNKVRDKYKNLSEEDRNKKRECAKNRYHNMSEQKKQKLKKHQKKYREAKKSEHNNLNIYSLMFITIILNKSLSTKYCGQQAH